MSDQQPKDIRFGRIKAKIWANETDFGTKYNTSFVRLYKKDDKWHDATSFNAEDLLLLSKVADAAHTWIFTQTPEHTTDSDDAA